MKVCIIEGCGGKHIAKGYCSTHYKRFQTHGTPQADKPKENHNKRLRNIGITCISIGCKRPAERAQLCMAHYQRKQKYGETLPNKPIIEFKGWYVQKDGYI